ncbi:tautomerase family protein [Streptomyces pseudogriseolus]|uniref:tautomerase family protein n=1 Tax=Streptomyces pseudogriseolus TaxID=36817 RepID=UPI003FA27299
MPFIDVKLYDRRLTEETERALIEGLTRAVVDVLGEEAREQTWVALTGVAPRRWGIGGVPGA